MTKPEDEIQRVKKYVLVFDICSSTKILEQLLQSENENRWRDLLIDLKNFLRMEKARHGFDIYKFVGDGWILLFDEDFPAEDLFAFLRRLSEAYGHSFVQRINRVLSNRIDSIGLTFGLELGSLIRFEINENTEFIGRAINVASRLQGAVKQDPQHPENVVLMSMHVYERVRDQITKTYRVRRVSRQLYNVAGGDDYLAIKLNLFEAPEAETSAAEKNRVNELKIPKMRSQSSTDYSTVNLNSASIALCFWTKSVTRAEEVQKMEILDTQIVSHALKGEKKP